MFNNNWSIDTLCHMLARIISSHKTLSSCTDGHTKTILKSMLHKYIYTIFTSVAFIQLEIMSLWLTSS